MKAFIEITILTAFLVLSSFKGVEEIFPEDDYSLLSDSLQNTSLQDTVLISENSDSLNSICTIGSVGFFNDSFPPCIPPWWPETEIVKWRIEYFPIDCGPWIIILPEKDLREENTTSIVLDYRLPTNELESIISPAGFEVERLASTTSTGKETLVISIYRAGYLDITVRDQNSNQIAKVHSQYTEIGQHSFEIDLSNYYNGYYFVCIEHGPDQKILPIKRMDAGLVNS